jgi:16S rRNA (uracil1498-N3)-methyltransferase
VLVPAAAREGEVLEVPADEAGHLVRVLRLGPGAAVRVFDGRGHEWDATLRATTKHGAVVALGAKRASAPEPRVHYTLAVAVLKGDATDDVVRDAVMMGVQAIRPFVSARTEVRAAALERAHRRERWERVATASAKQCGRAVLPVIHEVADLSAVLASDGDALRLLLVEPGVGGTAAQPRDLAEPRAVSLAIGPEGGWTADEAASAVGAGWQPLRLGGRVLRAEAAPLVALAACQAVWSDT